MAANWLGGGAVLPRIRVGDYILLFLLFKKKFFFLINLAALVLVSACGI